MSDFTTYLRLERSLSVNTIKSYSSDILQFFEFLNQSEIINLSEVNLNNLSLFIANQQKREISKRSLARLISSIKALFKYLEIENEIESNPSKLIDAPKINKYLPVVLSVEEIDILFASIDLSPPEGERNRAIFEVLYSCGLRVSELVNLKLTDLFIEDGFIRVVGKGDKQRLVPIGEMAVDTLKNYLKGRKLHPVQPKSENIVFLNRRGGKISREMIFIIVKKQAEIAGITKEISPHTFRHSFATHLVENGADLRVVQEMLGHKSVLTTEIYTHVDSTKWQQGVLKYHPRR